jgi:hypothetical protein
VRNNSLFPIQQYPINYYQNKNTINRQLPLKKQMDNPSSLPYSPTNFVQSTISPSSQIVHSSSPNIHQNSQYLPPSKSQQPPNISNLSFEFVQLNNTNFYFSSKYTPSSLASIKINLVDICNLQNSYDDFLENTKNEYDINQTIVLHPFLPHFSLWFSTDVKFETLVEIWNQFRDIFPQSSDFYFRKLSTENTSLFGKLSGDRVSKYNHIAVEGFFYCVVSIKNPIGTKYFHKTTFFKILIKNSFQQMQFGKIENNANLLYTFFKSFNNDVNKEQVNNLNAMEIILDLSELPDEQKKIIEGIENGFLSELDSKSRFEIIYSLFVKDCSFPQINLLAKHLIPPAQIENLRYNLWNIYTKYGVSSTLLVKLTDNISYPTLIKMRHFSDGLASKEMVKNFKSFITNKIMKKKDFNVVSENDGAIIKNILTTLKLSSIQMSLMGFFDNVQNVILHIHFDGFRMNDTYFTILSYCYALLGFSNLNTNTISLIKKPEEDCTNEIVNFGKEMVEIGKTKYPIYSFKSIKAKWMTFEILFCVDLKAQLLTFQLQHVMLILFLEGTKRYVYALPIDETQLDFFISL